MAITTSDEKQVHHALSVLSNLRRAVLRHTHARSSQGWAGSTAEREKLARVARKVWQVVYADEWHNPRASLDQSAGHLRGRVEVCADADKKFVPDFAADTLDKIEDFEQALQSRLGSSRLIFPITPSDLTRLAGLKDVRSVTKQIDRAINEHRRKSDKLALAKRMRGHDRQFQEIDLRQAYPNLRKSQLKEFFASALEIK